MINSLENEINQKNFFTNWESLRTKLLNDVFEQENSVNDTVDALIKENYKSPKEVTDSELKIRQETGLPDAILSFIGPASSGKAFLGEQLAKNLNKSFKIFDMSQYSTVEDGFNLYGINDENEMLPEGELIKFIRKNQQSVIIFEDIEKAEIPVQLSLLNIFTNREFPVDFSKSIIIFSTTIGNTLFQDSDFYNYYKTDKIRSHSLLVNVLLNEKRIIIDCLVNTFSPKFVSFLSHNNIIMFKSLSIKSIARIGLKSIYELINNLFEKTGLEIKIEKPDIFAIFLSLYLSPDINSSIVSEKLPEILFEKMTSFIKKENKIPAKINFTFSQAAERVLNNLLKKNKSIEKELIRKSEYLKLKWAEDFKDGILNFKIVSVNLRRFLPNISINEGKFPVIEISKIGFKDIAGQNKVKENLKEIIRIFKKPHLLQHFKIDMPKGMILYGPSGVGKSLLAKAFTREANLQYIKVSGSDLFDPIYLHSVYEKAKEYSPCIVFLEQIDIKGIVDGVVTGIPSDWLLSELEDVKNQNVFTIATVNKKEEIDPEIISQGKLEIHIEVQALDKEARRFYITKILKKPHDEKINIDRVVHYISGMSGDDLERLSKEASLAAIRNNLDYITEEILIEQINIIKYGTKLEGNKLKNFEEDLRKTAYHEAGHAILSLILRPEVVIEQVTISPRSDALGFVSYKIEDYLENASREEIMNNICVMLAGRIAKIKKFGKNGMDTGSINDLEQATAEAYFAIASFGMDDELGYISIGAISNNINRILYSQIEERLLNWIKEATIRAEKMVEINWNKITALAELLTSKEVVEGFELEQIMKEK